MLPGSKHAVESAWCTTHTICLKIPHGVITHSGVIGCSHWPVSDEYRHMLELDVHAKCRLEACHMDRGHDLMLSHYIKHSTPCQQGNRLY